YLLLQFTAHILSYDSEITRLAKWVLYLILFALMISLTQNKVLDTFFEKNQWKWTRRAFQFLRVVLIFDLVAIIAADFYGYTYLSDYLAEGTFLTLMSIPFLAFLSRGIHELIEQKLFKKPSIVFYVEKDLINYWKSTFQRWSQIILWGFGLVWISIVWKITIRFYAFIKSFLQMGFTLSDTKITIGLLLQSLLAFYAAMIVSQIIQTILEKNIYPRKKWDRGIQNAISTGFHYVVVFIGFIISIRLLGFDIRNITVLAGAFGVGLGLGLQNLANNFASGIVLLMERPVKVGDIVQFGSVMGKVKKIGARATILETADQSNILIPNGDLLSNQVINWTYANSYGGAALPISVAYGTDVEALKLLLLEIASAHPEVRKNPAPMVEFKGFGESSIDFILRVWVNEVEDRRNVQSELFFEIEKAFREKKIEIPYPQREISIKT
ncbi:MAG: mechanosensitive ion channel, partial [Deltaproteobacteria bacterium]|nr:mechanosensitive ion channel [Deltaproteobacteria bacterium]